MVGGMAATRSLSPSNRVVGGVCLTWAQRCGALIQARKLCVGRVVYAVNTCMHSHFL